MFFQKAKVGLNEWWRYFAGTIMIFFGWQTIAMLPILMLSVYVRMNGGAMSLNPVQSAVSIGIDKNITLAIVLSAFLLACIVLFLVVKYFHKKPFLSVLTSKTSFSWKRAGFGFFVWLLLGLVMLYVGYHQAPEDYVFSFDAVTFLPLLLIAVLLLPFQTSFEEFFMRGYLMQGVGLVTRSRLLALLLPALIFGLLHSMNPEVFKYGFFKMMPFYIGMGLFLGIMAIMDEGIEMPIGVHFANNLSAALFVNMEDSALPTYSLFMLKNYNPVESIPYSLAMMAVFLVVAAIAFRWKDWGKLVRKIK